jgi:hypothetical protein
MDEDLVARMNDSQNRDRILNEFNRSTLDDVGPIERREQGMRVLQEMNELGEAEEQTFRDSMPRITVY